MHFIFINERNRLKQGQEREGAEMSRKKNERSEGSRASGT